MNVSEYILDFFAKKEINTAFVITGGQAMYLNDALARRDDYNVVFMHHEQSTAMSAEAYARIKNKPAIAMVTAGPGAINALNGVVGAYTDSSPIIVISGQAALRFVEYQEKTGIRQYGVQGINIKHIVKPITKYFVTVDSPQKIDAYLEKAYEEAMSGRPGPVWIEVPLDMQHAKVDADLLEKYVPAQNSSSTDKVQKTAVHILEKLQAAKRPLVLAGQGVSLGGARKELRDFIEYHQIPIITSRLGIDLIESEHPLYVGRPGNYGERSANFATQSCDLLIVLGSRLASATVGHNAKEFAKNAYKIVVDIDKNELDKADVDVQYKAQLYVKDLLSTLVAQSKEIKIADYSAWQKKCMHWKQIYPVCLPEYKNESPVNSYYFTDKLSELASSDASVLVDTGSCFHVAAQTWKVKKGQTFLTTGGISSMGYWVACIGACMANDKKQTICITGDGSLQMNIQEFATIKQNNLPIKVFILNNNGYLLIRHTQKNFMDNRLFGEGEKTGVWCPDSLEIAKAYQIKGVRINKVEELEEKIKEVLEYDGPVVCDVMTPEWQLLIPRVSSEKLADGSLISRDYDDMFPYLSSEELEKNRKNDD